MPVAHHAGGAVARLVESLEDQAVSSGVLRDVDEIVHDPNSRIVGDHDGPVLTFHGGESGIRHKDMAGLFPVQNIMMQGRRNMAGVFLNLPPLAHF